MRNTIIALGFATVATIGAAAMFAPTLASADNDCHEPRESWKEASELKTLLEADGLVVLEIEVDDGCYEVHVRDAQGLGTERIYNPATLEFVKMDD